MSPPRGAAPPAPRPEGWLRRETLLGGRPFEARRLFLAISAAQGFFFSLALGTYGLYVVREAQLSPVELILAGTALEGAALLSEVPTGVLADVYSRRLSLIVGAVVTSIGFALMGLAPSFVFVALGQAVWGVGYTFGSGAREAWLADEIGEETAARTYVRGTQLGQVGRIVGLFPGVGFAVLDLQAPLLVTAALFLGMAFVLALRMPEHGFGGAHAAPEAASEARAGGRRFFFATFFEGLRVVRGSTVLLSILAVAFLAGASSEVFDRLYPLHFLETFEVPALGPLDEVGWFGVLSLGALAGGIVVAEVLVRRVDMRSTAPIAAALVLLTLGIVASTLTFALAGSFWVALVAFWATNWLRIATQPLVLAWANRGLPSSSRATVLSMLGQADALGQVLGGPSLGLLATWRGVRLALTAVGVVLAPSTLVYARLLRAPAAGLPSEDASTEESGKPSR